MDVQRDEIDPSLSLTENVDAQSVTVETKFPENVPATTAPKKKEVEKSLVVLEVKPWEADTDLEAAWKEIIKFQQEGLLWDQTFKLEPVAFGIKKLVFSCTVIDELVNLNDITENIEALEDYVQSVEITKN